MNAVATPTRPKAKTKAAQTTAPASRTIPDQEAAFMEGKALAALVVREGELHGPMTNADLNASYREPGQPQSNFTLPFFQLLQREPNLLPGFSAAMSSMLAEADFSGDIAEATAKINYSACTEYRDADAYERFDSYSEPPLDRQLADLGLEDFVTMPPTAQPGKETLPAADTSPQWALDALDRAETKIDQAEHVLQSYAEHAGCSATWGLLLLVETLKPSIAKYRTADDLSDPQGGALQDLSGDIDNVAEVVRLVNEELDSLILHAVVSLLRLAQSIAEEACDSEHQEHANG